VEKTAYLGASWSVLLTKYYPGDQIKMNEMGGACGMYEEKDRCMQGFGGETIREKIHLEDGRIILKLIFKKRDRVRVGWIGHRIRMCNGLL